MSPTESLKCLHTSQINSDAQIKDCYSFAKMQKIKTLTDKRNKDSFLQD